MEDNKLSTTNELLKAILDEMSLLTVQIKFEAQQAFQKEFLTTQARRDIYGKIDGKRDTSELSKETGASLRSVQHFIKELEEHDLIEIKRDGRRRIPEKAIHKIAFFYGKKQLDST